MYEEPHAGSVVAASVSMSTYEPYLEDSVSWVLLVSPTPLPPTVLPPPLPQGSSFLRCPVLSILESVGKWLVIRKVIYFCTLYRLEHVSEFSYQNFTFAWWKTVSHIHHVKIEILPPKEGDPRVGSHRYAMPSWSVTASGACTPDTKTVSLESVNWDYCAFRKSTCHPYEE